MTIGVTLEHLKILSTDPDFKEMFVNEPHMIIFKLVSLKNLSVYINTFSGDQEMTYFSHGEKLAEELGPLIPTDEKPVKHNYVLRPLSLSVKAIVNKSSIPSSDIPKVSVDVVLEAIQLTVSEKQFHDLMGFLNYMMLMERRHTYRQFRPSTEKFSL